MEETERVFFFSNKSEANNKNVANKRGIASWRTDEAYGGSGNFSAIKCTF